MAQKRVVKKTTSSIDDQINQNPLYMKLCSSSSACESEKKLTDLGDMTANVCTQCLHIFGWEMKVVEKVAKVKTEKVTKKQIEEAKIVEPEVENKAPEADDKDSAIEKSAQEMKDAFEQIDSMGIDVMGTEAKSAPEETKSSGLSFDDDFDLEFKEKPAQESVFLIVDFSVISTTEIALICNTASGKTRFKVTTTTSPDKVKIISDSPEKVKGKGAKVSFKGLDEKGRPKEPEYISFAKFEVPA